MNRLHAFTLAAAVLAAPLALASDNPFPKNYCEDPSEWGTHYYAGATSVRTFLLAAQPQGHPPESDYTGIAALVVSDGNAFGDCNGDTVPADYDGHSEWGVGGAILTVAPETVTGCAVEVAHHLDGTIHVEDRVLGSGVTFVVGADYFDTTNPLNPVPGCDLLVDQAGYCWGWCDPTFMPGADGAFWVYPIAPATKGHIYTT